MSLGLAHGHSLRALASMVGRAPRTVSREWARTVTRGRPSRACTAQIQAAARACPPRRLRTLLDPWLWTMGGHSGPRAARRSRVPGASDTRLRTTGSSPAQRDPLCGAVGGARGALRSARLAAVRQARPARRPRARGTDRRGQMPYLPPMAARPAEVAPRTGPGHGEGELIRGLALGRPSGPWWSGRHAWSVWPGWTGRMRGVPARASRRHASMCRLPCATP